MYVAADCARGAARRAALRDADRAADRQLHGSHNVSFTTLPCACSTCVTRDLVIWISQSIGLLNSPTCGNRAISPRMAPLDPHGAAQWLGDVGAPFAGVLLALYLDGSALPEFVKARGRRGRSVDTAKGGGSARARNRKR